MFDHMNNKSLPLSLKKDASHRRNTMSNPKKSGKKEKAASVGKKGEGGGGEDAKRDQKLQAILLADSFQKAFRPVTWETPKVLLPLVNVPMLEYTIEFLAQNGVEEVFNKLSVNSCSLLILLPSHSSCHKHADFTGIGRDAGKDCSSISFLLLLYICIFHSSSAFRILCLACRNVAKLLTKFKVVDNIISEMYNVYSLFICW